jgi:hypothetical protein
MPDPAEIPILILAFNRPDYLTETLDSLMAQRGVEMATRRVFLFQDGGRNPSSGQVHCSDAVVVNNVDIFRRLVPQGVPIVSYANLGVALNFERAERFAFEELGAEAAIFLEDDFVLGPYYLKTLDQLLALALADERIGYVAAYGDHRAPFAEQQANPSRLTHMSHNWAFGLTRRQWLRQKPFVDQYLALVRGQDYRTRDSDPIIDLFHSWGLGAPGTSQDIAKSHACYLTGAVRLTTYACFGRYIGRQGLHFNDAQFEAMGFGATKVMQEDVFRLVPPTDAELHQMLDAARQGAVAEVVKRRVPRPGVPTPNEAGPALDRVRGLIQGSRFDEAETLALEWLARAPAFRDQYGHPAFLKELTRIALARGRLTRARELADRLAAALPPEDPCVNVLFARAYHKMGAVVAALAEWHVVLAKQPENPEAREFIQDTQAAAAA